MMAVLATTETKAAEAAMDLKLNMVDWVGLVECEGINVSSQGRKKKARNESVFIDFALLPGYIFFTSLA